MGPHRTGDPQRQPRNEIARAFKRSAGTVKKIAREIGVESDRSETKAAIEARAADNARKLEELKTMLLDEALRQGQAMHVKAKSFQWHDGKLLEKEIPEPTFTDTPNGAGRCDGGRTSRSLRPRGQSPRV